MIKIDPTNSIDSGEVCSNCGHLAFSHWSLDNQAFAGACVDLDCLNVYEIADNSKCKAFIRTRIQPLKNNDYPHKCRDCKMDAYIGAYEVICSNINCKHRDRKLFPEMFK